MRLVLIQFTNVHIMKHLRSEIQRSKSKHSLSGNKQNTPFNAAKQEISLGAQAASKKIGIEIRNRIQKIATQGLTELSLNHNQPMNTGIPKLRHSQSIMVTTTHRVKSVSFDENERGAYSSLESQGNKKSILKKSRDKSKQFGSLQKSRVSLANSHVNNQDQSIQNSIGNKVISEKYERLLRDLKTEKKKYKDEIYPPLQSSIYLANSLMKNFCEMFQREGRTIEWMRLSELFKHKQMVVWTSNQHQKSNIVKGHISKTGGDGDFLSNVLNCLKSKNTLLEKLFESQTINKQCIYFVKIHQTQTNIWKYVVVDDYIPVIINKKLGSKERYLPENVHPAFLGVRPQGNLIQIWPFLLQKAYAKYYSTYDSLANGNTLDFLQEITGTLLNQIKISDHQNISKIMRNQDTLLLAQDKKGVIYPLKNSSFQRQQLSYIYLDREDEYKQKKLTYEEFYQKFVTIHYSHLHKYFHTSRCLIQQENVKSKVKKSAEAYILREFILQESCQCQIATIQKQQRFYRTYLTYDYAWMRVILVQKESNSYRWIAASYSNTKTTKIAAVLTPGEYVVIIMPEWKDKPYDFNLIFKGNCQTFFERKPYELYKNIIQQSCMDVAQRYGKMVQVNKNICSYHFIEKNIGFIIENINNEKESGSVKILRSIDGLQSYNIRPLNEQFHNKVSAEIVIPKRSHYTVVLMTTKGVERSFLEMFDFGF